MSKKRFIFSSSQYQLLFASAAAAASCFLSLFWMFYSDLVDGGHRSLESKSRNNSLESRSRSDTTSTQSPWVLVDYVPEGHCLPTMAEGKNDNN